MNYNKTLKVLFIISSIIGLAGINSNYLYTSMAGVMALIVATLILNKM